MINELSSLHNRSSQLHDAFIIGFEHQDIYALHDVLEGISSQYDNNYNLIIMRSHRNHDSDDVWSDFIFIVNTYAINELLNDVISFASKYETKLNQIPIKHNYYQLDIALDNGIKRSLLEISDTIKSNPINSKRTRDSIESLLLLLETYIIAINKLV